jgi:hypothetical protein
VELRLRVQLFPELLVQPLLVQLFLVQRPALPLVVSRRLL